VSVDQIERAQSSVRIATVQNEYNVGTRRHQDVFYYCTTRGIGFIPFYPLRIGELAGSERLKAIAALNGVTPAGVTLPGYSRDRRSLSREDGLSEFAIAEMISSV
jgi:pyridoxine 4-dehydrogenase